VRVTPANGRHNAFDLDDSIQSIDSERAVMTLSKLNREE